MLIRRVEEPPDLRLHSQQIEIIARDLIAVDVGTALRQLSPALEYP